ncbi:MAG: CDP-alcohol phosphatidyltransferase family protein [Bacteroidetes bacterium]|nr:CDP-alcohol phosphatidyltransferase family protein [Bacteroidota bacterium]
MLRLPQNTADWSLWHAGLMLFSGAAALLGAGLSMLFLSYIASMYLAMVFARLEDPSMPRWTVANGVTALRLITLGMLLTRLPSEYSEGLQGWIDNADLIALGTMALILDGFDGYAARRQGNATPFGARFDMETDALWAWSLSIAWFNLGLAPGVVLLAGALRYLFVLFVVARRPAGRDAKRRLAPRIIAVVYMAVLLTPLAIPAPLVLYLLYIGSGAIVVSFLRYR